MSKDLATMTGAELIDAYYAAERAGNMDLLLAIFDAMIAAGLMFEEDLSFEEDEE